MDQIVDVPTVDLDDDALTNPIDLARVVMLAHLQVSQERAVEEAEETLDRAKAALRRTREADLPEALAAAGLSSLTLDSGDTIEVVKEIFAGIPKDKEDEAFKWFIRNEYGDLVKNTITVKLPRGLTDMVRRLRRSLTRFNNTLTGKERFEVKYKQEVHHQTLQKFVRDAENTGRDDLPEDLLGIFRRRVTRVVRPEERSF